MLHAHVHVDAATALLMIASSSHLHRHTLLHTLSRWATSHFQQHLRSIKTTCAVCASVTCTERVPSNENRHDAHCEPTRPTVLSQHHTAHSSANPPLLHCWREHARAAAVCTHWVSATPLPTRTHSQAAQSLSHAAQALLAQNLSAAPPHADGHAQLHSAVCGMQTRPCGHCCYLQLRPWSPCPPAAAPVRR